VAGPPSPEVSVDSTEPTLSRALRVWPRSEGWEGHVHSGWDVFGIPHGGYLAALTANAGLQASGASDVLTITTHFLSKATVGPIQFEVRPLGGGRRLSSYLVEASQEGRATMTSMLSVGDRTQLRGPTFQQRTAPDLDDRLSGPAGSAGEPFPTPRIAQLLGMRVDRESQGFAEGRVGEEAVLRAAIDPVAPTATDQLLAIVACDATPPAAWNALGISGWVPTVELTVHVRARPAPGTLRVVASTRSVTDGLLEEDAEVYDDAGTLVVLSRQLARWTEMEG
jgi:acyl-coenzyme A thioesterase PaaI-like protein